MSEEKRSFDDYIAAADEGISRLEKHVPAVEERPSNQSEPQRELNCPMCGQPLERGIVSVHGTFWGMMVVGFSHQQCWFEPAGGAAEEEIIPSGCAKRGWRCKGCIFVGIEGGEARPAKNAGIGDL